MPKKSSSEKPSEMQENPIEKPETTTPKTKKHSNVIDEIFAEVKKRKKPEQEQSKKPKEDDNSKADKMKKKKKKSKAAKEDEFGDWPSRPRKRMGDGLTIYTEEELGTGKADAGGTPLCPFDCSCCF